MPKRRKQNVWWGNRDVTPTPYYGLCLTKKNFRRECKRLGAKRYGRRWITRGSDATTHFLEETKSGKASCIVCIDPKKDGHRDPVEIQGVLIHEGVHVWQEQLRAMREDKPSSEFEAYAVQAIAQNLIHAWNEMTKPKDKKGKTQK